MRKKKKQNRKQYSEEDVDLMYNIFASLFEDKYPGIRKRPVQSTVVKGEEQE